MAPTWNWSPGAHSRAIGIDPDPWLNSACTVSARTRATPIPPQTIAAAPRPEAPFTQPTTTRGVDAWAKNKNTKPGQRFAKLHLFRTSFIARWEGGCLVRIAAPRRQQARHSSMWVFNWLVVRWSNQGPSRPSSTDRFAAVSARHCPPRAEVQIDTTSATMPGVGSRQFHMWM